MFESKPIEVLQVINVIKIFLKNKWINGRVDIAEDKSESGWQQQSSAQERPKPRGGVRDPQSRGEEAYVREPHSAL